MRDAKTGRARTVGAITLASSVLLGACDFARSTNNSSSPPTASASECSIPTNLIYDGGPGKDGIPALTDPRLVGANDADASYVRDNDRVIGFEIDGEAIAMPHNIGWWHEIVNFAFNDQALAVTYCPLTGSSLAFDRRAVQGAELGVSGLLYNTNLIMYDRTSEESLWPQMSRGARCGPRDGAQLTMYPVIDMTWAGWKSLHPDTRVISSSTGASRNYQQYPYGNYEEVDNRELFFPVTGSVDARRSPKERVLAIPAGDEAGIAFPFLALNEDAALRAINTTVAGRPVVVLWERAREAAAAYRPVSDGENLTFEVSDGRIRDVGTGSEWRIDGRAVDGPLEGVRLEPIAEAYVAFWFAWAAFHPGTEIWTEEG